MIQHDDIELVIRRQIDLSSTRADDPNLDERDQGLHSHVFILACVLQKPSRIHELTEILEQLTFEVAASRILREQPT